MSKEAPSLAESANAAIEKVEKPKGNPALKAMGIPYFKAKMPGPKWVAFWCVLASGVGGWLYDKREQTKIRDAYCAKVSQILEENTLNKDYPWYLKSRKLSVFIAPPPDDYLETSMQTWRKYIKPVLFSAGLDYELYTSDTQGALRLQVSREIRNLRSEIIQYEDELKRIREKKQLESSLKFKLGKVWQKISNLNSRFTQRSTEAIVDPVEEIIQGKKFKSEFDLKNLLGVFYDNKEMAKHTQSTTEDSLQEDIHLAGGVICIGRGSYKEYIAGLNEGLLGPLEMPDFVKESLEEKKQEWRDKQLKDKPDHLLDETKMPDYVPKSYIDKNDYAKYTYPPKELENRARDIKTNIPYIFKQPILCIPQPIISGFLNFPRKVYRFYTKRYQAEEYCRQATSLVLQSVRPLKEEDLLRGKVEEEDEWPKGWVKTGIAKGSEWIQPITCDSRILKDLTTYDVESVPRLYSHNVDEHAQPQE